ncbi:MAG: MFS transporter [Sphingomonas fennica]
MPRSPTGDAAPPPRDGLPGTRRLRAIGALCFGTALVVIDGAIVTVALPTIARDLQIASSSAVLIVTVYQLTLVMTLLPFSALGDRIGLRTLYQYGQALFLVATILCFFSRSLPFLLVARTAQGLGAAAALSVSSALVRGTYPASQLGRGLSINGVIVASAGAISPTLGGFVLSAAPWPWVFASAAPFAILSLLLGRALPDPEPRDVPYDMLGATLCALVFGLVIGGLESLVHGDSPVVATAVVAAGAALGVLFVRHELKQDQPVMPVDLLGRPVLALSAAGALTAFVASMTTLLSMPFRLQHDYGLSPAEIGAMIGTWPIVMLVISPLAGILSDKVPAGVLGGIGMTIATGGLLTVAWLPPQVDFFDVAWRMMLCGTGFGLFLSPNARLIVGSAPRHRAAAAGGLIATTRMTGQTLGATVFATLLAIGIGTGPTPALVAAGLTVAAGICSVARLRPSLHQPQRDDVPDL